MMLNVIRKDDSHLSEGVVKETPNKNRFIITGIGVIQRQCLYARDLIIYVYEFLVETIKKMRIICTLHVFIRKDGP